MPSATWKRRNIFRPSKSMRTEYMIKQVATATMAATLRRPRSRRYSVNQNAPQKTGQVAKAFNAAPPMADRAMSVMGKAAAVNVSTYKSGSQGDPKNNAMAPRQNNPAGKAMAARAARFLARQIASRSMG